jgi:FAD/FMN-containing dehydrogenase
VSQSKVEVATTRFEKLNDQDIVYFKNIVGAQNVIIEKEEIEPYNIDFTKKYKGTCSMVITPTSTEEISAVLKYCNDRKLAVVP